MSRWLLYCCLNCVESCLSVVYVLEVFLVLCDGSTSVSSLVPLQTRNPLLDHLGLLFLLPILLNFTVGVATLLSLYLLLSLNT